MISPAPAMILEAAAILASETGIPLENLGEEARGTYTRLAEKMLKAAVNAADGDAAYETPSALLAAYDEFIGAEPRSAQGGTTGYRVALAASFGVAAYEAAFDPDAGACAMIRAVLLALTDPASPDLDYLRVGEDGAPSHG